MYGTLAKLVLAGMGIGVTSYMIDQQRQKELEEARIKVKIENLKRTQMVMEELAAIHAKYDFKNQ